MEEVQALEESRSALLRLHKQLAEVLGIQTADVLFERAALEIGAAHPIVAAIRIEEGSLNLDGLDQASAGSSPEQVRAAFAALNAVVVLILARLVGRQIAEGIAERIDSGEALPVRLDSGRR